MKISVDSLDFCVALTAVILFSADFTLSLYNILFCVGPSPIRIRVKSTEITVREVAGKVSFFHHHDCIIILLWPPFVIKNV